MSNPYFVSMVRFLCLAALGTMTAAMPATAQVRSVPVGGGNLPPCEANANAFPCGVLLSSAGGSLSSKAIGAMTRSAGAHVRYEYTVIDAVAATVPHVAGMRALSLSSLRITPDRQVRLIEPLGRPGGGGGGGGGGTPEQITPEGVKRIGAPGSGKTGSGVGVAIVDTGLDFNHSDLKANISSGSGIDAFGGTCQDQNGHGTHVGGTVAAANNSIDVVGVAPQATLYCVRVLDASGSGSDSAVIAGLDWIYQQNGGVNNPSKPLKISVANMSLGRASSADDSLMQTAVDKLNTQGVTVVVAAGNDASKEISQMVPARFSSVMAIASTTAKTGTEACSRLSGAITQDTASFFSTDGQGVAISAPGEDQEDVSKGCMISSVGILSLKLGGGTTRMSGTSMASPHVTGVAALLYEETRQ